MAPSDLLQQGDRGFDPRRRESEEEERWLSLDLSLGGLFKGPPRCSTAASCPSGLSSPSSTMAAHSSSLSPSSCNSAMALQALSPGCQRRDSLRRLACSTTEKPAPSPQDLRGFQHARWSGTSQSKDLSAAALDRSSSPPESLKRKDRSLGDQTKRHRKIAKADSDGAVPPSARSSPQPRRGCGGNVTDAAAVRFALSAPSADSSTLQKTVASSEPCDRGKLSAGRGTPDEAAAVNPQSRAFSCDNPLLLSFMPDTCLPADRNNTASCRSSLTSEAPDSIEYYETTPRTAEPSYLASAASFHGARSDQSCKKDDASGFTHSSTVKSYDKSESESSRSRCGSNSDIVGSVQEANSRESHGPGINDRVRLHGNHDLSPPASGSLRGANFCSPFMASIPPSVSSLCSCTLDAAVASPNILTTQIEQGLQQHANEATWASVPAAASHWNIRGNGVSPSLNLIGEYAASTKIVRSAALVDTAPVQAMAECPSASCSPTPTSEASTCSAQEDSRSSSPASLSRPKPSLLRKVAAAGSRRGGLADMDAVAAKPVKTVRFCGIEIIEQPRKAAREGQLPALSASNGEDLRDECATWDIVDGREAEGEGDAVLDGCSGGKAEFSQKKKWMGSSPSIRGMRNKVVLPSVSTTSIGPEGKTIHGVMYITEEKHARLVCRCHGVHMTPAEFVQHSGSSDLINPEKRIVIEQFLPAAATQKPPSCTSERRE